MCFNTDLEFYDVLADFTTYLVVKIKIRARNPSKIKGFENSLKNYKNAKDSAMAPHVARI